MANPTTKRSRKVEESEVDAKNQALIQQLNELEHIWKSQETSRLHRSSLSSSTITTSFDHLFQTSPRSLMSHLQHREPALRVIKNCSDEVEEILTERRAAIISGRFKGRQLFAAAEELNGRGGERRGRRESCDSSESCSLPEEKRVVEVAVVGGGEGRPKEKGGGRRVVKAGLGLVLIVLALVLFCISCNGNNVEDFILVPT